MAGGGDEPYSGRKSLERLEVIEGASGALKQGNWGWGDSGGKGALNITTKLSQGGLKDRALLRVLNRVRSRRRGDEDKKSIRK